MEAGGRKSVLTESKMDGDEQERGYNPLFESKIQSQASGRCGRVRHSGCVQYRHKQDVVDSVVVEENSLDED